jgi:hypothetical protein
MSRARRWRRSSPAGGRRARQSFPAEPRSGHGPSCRLSVLADVDDEGNNGNSLCTVTSRAGERETNDDSLIGSKPTSCRFQVSARCGHFCNRYQGPTDGQIAVPQPSQLAAVIRHGESAGHSASGGVSNQAEQASQALMQPAAQGRLVSFVDRIVRHGKSKEAEMRMILALALVASILAACGPSAAPGWAEKTWEESMRSPGMGG